MTLFVREVVDRGTVVGLILAENSKGQPKKLEDFPPHKNIQDIHQVAKGYYRASSVEAGERVSIRSGDRPVSADEMWNAYDRGYYS